MSDLAIKVSHVSKDFRLVKHKSNTLKGAFAGLFRTGKKTVEFQHALRDISFEVKRGEFFGIVGRNGSGKSTLLKILAGIYQPNKGGVEVHGKLVPFIELGVGFNPELTGRENVYLNGAILGFSEKEVDGFYDEVVAFAELEDFMDQRLKNYSSGMQVRLAFSMAVRAQADILLIDEVLAVGDAAFQRKCYDYFKSLKKDKKTVIFVSHDMDAIRQFCDRAMLVDDGTIQKIGKVDTVAQSYIKLFIEQSSHHASSTGARWGEAPGSMGDLKIAVGPEINIEGSLKLKEPVKNPVLGFIVRDAAGTAILGANSKMVGADTAKLSDGSLHSFSWHFQNILSDGEYVIDVAITDEDGITIIEWWSAALKFSVRKAVVSPYVVNPEIVLRISRA